MPARDPVDAASIALHRRDPPLSLDHFFDSQVVASSGKLDEDVLVWEHHAPGQSVCIGALHDVTVSLMLNDFDLTARFPDGSQRRRRVRAGEVTVLSIDRPFNLLFESEARIRNVSLSARLMHQAAASSGCVARRLPTRPGLDDAVLRSLVGALHHAIAQPGPGQVSLLRLTGLAMAGHLLHRYGEAPVELRRGHATRLDHECAQVARHLQSRIDEPCRVEQLARLVNLSPSTLARRFKLATGMPPKQYHLRLRLEHARDALVRSRSSVMQAALAVGFDDPAHFSRAFKKQFGRPPSAFMA